METIWEYSLPSSEARVVIYHLETPQEELNNNKDNNISSSSLPLLSICFHLETHELCWYKPPNGSEQFQYHHPVLSKSLHLEYNPSIYTSYDLFYNALRENMENLGEEFENGCRHDIIHDMIGKVCEIVGGESDKGHREEVEVLVSVVFVVDRFLDESILGDDCVICLEELGKDKALRCTPCSHLFHKVCLEKWLNYGNSCPICYHLLDNFFLLQD